MNKGNDFLPHLPSLDIRDGALDFLFNVYKRILPTLGDYITNHGGEVNLSHVDVILAEVGAIEDYVFSMKHQNEENDKKRKEQYAQRKKLLTKNGQAPLANHPGGQAIEEVPKVRGRAARILNQNKDTKALGKHSQEANAKAAEELKASLMNKSEGTKRKSEDISKETETKDGNSEEEEASMDGTSMEETSMDDNSIEEVEEITDEEKKAALVLLKKKLKETEQKKLNDYAANVQDNVRLHEKGWKVSSLYGKNLIQTRMSCILTSFPYLYKNRYYTDKCKADDVQENGGREHLFRSYVMGLCWVMKYYYEGCPSWKWFYPFHYAPFASGK